MTCAGASRGFGRYSRMTRTSILFAAVLLSACSSGEKEEQAEPSATPEATAAPTPAPTVGRIFSYTSLEKCPVLESNPEEAGYYLSECKGEGGYKVRVIESDLRQTVEIISPAGAKTGLELSSVTGGGFSHLGKNAEWRGPLKDGVFAPDALVLRHEVVTDPEGKNTVSYLVAVKLDGTPCVTARIAPGPEQNAEARAAADAKGACLV